MAKAVAIIPSRGGGIKRIPRKNIKDFFGKVIVFMYDKCISKK